MSEQELRAQEIMDTYGHEWMAERIAELEAENVALKRATVDFLDAVDNNPPCVNEAEDILRALLKGADDE